ncbi:MAG: hemerythrin domain-containing protein [Rubrivivax sp.]
MPASLLPYPAAPAAGFDEPFAMLAACHERVERSLRLLERLAAYLARHGCDAQAADAARDVMRYFDLAAPAHHEDEERHVLPVLRANGDEAFAAQIEQEHREMRRRWAELRRDLVEVAAGRWTGAAAADFVRWQQFVTLYRAHTDSEDAHAFPVAETALDAAKQHEMGLEMARRRGQRR